MKLKPFSVTLFASVSFVDVEYEVDKNFLELYMLPKKRELLRKCKLKTKKQKEIEKMQSKEKKEIQSNENSKAITKY